MPGQGYSNVYSFDDIVVDAGNYRVLKGGSEVGLTPRAFDVLTLLIKERGRVVEKQHIFETIWKDTFVSDQALTKIIKEIRHALGDSAQQPKYIETVPKRGYRFIGDIRDEMPRPTSDATENEHPGANTEPTSSSARVRASSSFFNRTRGFAFVAIAVFALAVFGWLVIRQNRVPEPSHIRTIAVLPFRPLDSSSRNESLEMGMAETLITRLSNLQQVAVRPISAVSQYTDPQQDAIAVGKTMGVEAVIDGNIQKADERIRVTVRLLDVGSGKTLWSDHFDENFTDIFKVQDSIAERVSSALALELTRQEREQLAKHYTEDEEAYQLYLNAQLVWNGRRQNWIEQSLTLYKQAVEKDPNFALAYIGMADCYIMLNGHHKMPAAETEANARPAIMKALEIDNSLAQAHNALAELRYQYEFNWSDAEAEFKKAIGLNPNVAWIRQAYGWYLMSAAKFDEARAEMELAHELDPSSLTINVGRGRLLYYSRQYDEAIRHFQSLISVEPNDPSLYRAIYTVYVMKAMYPEAVDALLKSMTLAGAPDEFTVELRRAFEIDGWNGFVRKRLEMAKAKSGGWNSELADIYRQLGMKDEAILSLKRAVDAHEPAAIQLKIEPSYDGFRDNPRFADLVRAIGLYP
jgi:DNA-binding winged helix-turn-helix (wHTH) protein/TolB-like protein